MAAVPERTNAVPEAVPNVLEWLSSIAPRFPCISSISESSFGQSRNHREDAVSDDLQLGIDLGEIARRLEDVEVPVEWNLIAGFRLVVIDPPVGSVWQD